MLSSLRHRLARGTAVAGVALFASATPPVAERAVVSERMVVAPPRFEGALDGIGPGYADWVRSALGSVGIEVVSRDATLAASGSDFPKREDVTRLAAQLDAGFVLLTEARASAGRLVVSARWE